ncbi:MAG: alpha-D-glucose phosphate-specific phosphoglucomutase, partial [Sulfurospirillum sp.]
MSKAGLLPSKNRLENIPKLISDFYLLKPIHSEAKHKVSFGTSGHRGKATQKSFNQNHILAITQAICDYRSSQGINGKLFLAKDTHALSYPAELTAISVLIANGVETYIAKDNGYTPTPAISHAIICENIGTNDKSDGIVITPSHNPPSDGGIKYNTPDGGPADTDVTKWIENRANELLENSLKGVKYLSIEEAQNSKHLHHFDFVSNYVSDLKNIIDIDAIKSAGIKIGADCLGGSGMEYYRAIKSTYGLDMDILHDYVDEQFGFMHLDHDEKIRMDCSSPYAMRGLIDLKDK